MYLKTSVCLTLKVIWNIPQRGITADSKIQLYVFMHYLCPWLVNTAHGLVQTDTLATHICSWPMKKWVAYTEQQ